MDFESTPDNGPNLSVADSKPSATTVPSNGRITGENTPTGRKTPVKPSLKSTSTSNSDDESECECESNNNNNRNKKKAAKKKKKNRTLKWDEAKIQEHDQLRGTRMKIDEPNTPFAHYDSGSETDCSLSSHKGNAHHKISWDALTNKLEAHAAVAGGVGVPGVAGGVAGGVLYPPGSPSSHGGGNLSSDGGGNYTTDEEDEDQKRERQREELKRLEFQEHRKRHYNEMEVVRRFRRECPDGEPTSNGHSSEDNDHHHDTDNDNDNSDNDNNDNDNIDNNDTDNDNDGDDENEQM